MELSNPLLLSVKMFLADIRSWRYEYGDPEYVCADFEQDVYDKASTLGMRCGYAAISFQSSEVGHAIVAFETDYGLIFIEPQDGEQVDVLVGKSYPVKIDGVPEENIISSVDISWNDGTSTQID